MKEKTPLLIRLGTNIRSIREQRGLSQEQLALTASLDRTYIGGVERGERNISITNLCKLAYSLDVTPSQLLEGVFLDDNT